MGKCRCGSKKFEEIQKIFVCVTCKHVYSNQPKLDTLKKLLRNQERNEQKKAYNEAMEDLQKKRTAENLARRKLKEN